MRQPSRRWLVEAVRDTPAAVHELEPPDSGQPSIWVIEPSGPALVLGSTQSLDDVDLEAASAQGLEIVSRRSGGGAVLVAPDSLVWIDVIVPSDDPLWIHDVGLAAQWLGELWAAIIGELGPVETAPEVHRGPMISDDLAKRVCFAGLGPGEVTVGGRKLVGISQRRTRSWVRFQCAFLLEWEWRAIADLFPGLSAVDKERLEFAAVGSGWTATDVVDAFVGAISSS